MSSKKDRQRLKYARFYNGLIAAERPCPHAIQSYRKSYTSFLLSVVSIFKQKEAI